MLRIVIIQTNRRKHGPPTLGSYRGKWQEDGRLTSISSQIVR